MAQIFVNNFYAELDAECAAGALSMTYRSATFDPTIGAGDYLLITLYDATDDTHEIVKATAVSGGVFTITKGQEGTTDATWPVGTQMQARITAGSMGLSSLLDGGGDTLGSNATNLQSGRDTSDQVASGADAVAVGHSSKASGTGGTALGTDAVATTGVAVGRAANAGSGVAIGQSAVIGGTSNVGIGHGNLIASTDRTVGSGVSLLGGYNNVGITHITAIPYPLLLPVADSPDESTAINNMWRNWGHRVVFATFPVCIGDGPDWQATHSYKHGDVVLPTTPNGYSYCNYMYGTDYYSSGNSGSSEPSWPATAEYQWTGADGDLAWFSMDPEQVVITVPDYTRFIPLRVGFMTDRLAGALTANPVLRFGPSTGSPAGWLAAQEFMGLGAAYQLEMHDVRQNLANTFTASKTLVAGVVSGSYAAGDCIGRFIFDGLLVETMEA